MNLRIDLSPTEAAQLSAAAQASGLTPEALVKKLLHTYLPTRPDAATLDALLVEWQAQEETPLVLDMPAATLEAQWAQEDARMTEAEQAEEDRLWAELEPALTESPRVLQLRQDRR